MSRRILLSLDGVTAVAELLEAEAPLTAEKFWSGLPFDETFRHVRRSGCAAYFISPRLRDATLPFEGRVSFYTPGTICLKPSHGEIAIAYGQAQARTVTGNEYASCFARFVGDHTAFLDAIRRMQRGGSKRLSVTKHEG